MDVPKEIKALRAQIAKFPDLFVMLCSHYIYTAPHMSLRDTLLGTNWDKVSFAEARKQVLEGFSHGAQCITLQVESTISNSIESQRWQVLSFLTEKEKWNEFPNGRLLIDRNIEEVCPEAHAKLKACSDVVWDQRMNLGKFIAKLGPYAAVHDVNAIRILQHATNAVDAMSIINMQFEMQLQCLLLSEADIESPSFLATLQEAFDGNDILLDDREKDIAILAVQAGITLD